MKDRIIKFRAQRIHDGSWVYGLLRKRLKYSTGIIEDENGLGSDIALETLGQYTGLNDKNGKEIYEGDILGWDYFVEANPVHGQSIVEWKEHIPGFDLGLFDKPSFCDFEVIGNIYEKQDLSELNNEGNMVEEKGRWSPTEIKGQRGRQGGKE